MAVSELDRLTDFIRESNKIEGIVRDPTEAEVYEAERFMGLHEITIQDLQTFVSVYQPDARLRDQPGLNVMVGGQMMPPGGPAIVEALSDLLHDIKVFGRTPANSWDVHQRYEHLHPFTDGNGRSGRMIWWWMTGGRSQIGFLHAWYYQSLREWREEA